MYLDISGLSDSQVLIIRSHCLSRLVEQIIYELFIQASLQFVLLCFSFLLRVTSFQKQVLYAGGRDCEN